MHPLDGVRQLAQKLRDTLVNKDRGQDELESVSWRIAIVILTAPVGSGDSRQWLEGSTNPITMPPRATRGSRGRPPRPRPVPRAHRRPRTPRRATPSRLSPKTRSSSTTQSRTADAHRQPTPPPPRSTRSPHRCPSSNLRSGPLLDRDIPNGCAGVRIQQGCWSRCWPVPNEMPTSGIRGCLSGASSWSPRFGVADTAGGHEWATTPRVCCRNSLVSAFRRCNQGAFFGLAGRSRSPVTGSPE
jgi:hypothetical protein